MSSPEREQPSNLPVQQTPRPESDSAPSISTSWPGLSGLTPAYGEPPPESPPGLSSAPSVQGLWHAFRRRWLTAVVLGVVGALGAVFLTMELVPGKYSASAYMQLTQPRQLEALGAERVDFRTFRENQAGLIASHPVLKATLQRQEVLALSVVQQHVQNNIESTKWLGKQIKTDFETAPSIMHVYLPGEDPHAIKVILNAIVEEYKKYSEIKLQNRIEAAIKDLQKKQTEGLKKLQSIEEKINFERERLRIPPKAQREADERVERTALEATQKALLDEQRDHGDLEADLDIAESKLQKLNSGQLPKNLSTYLSDPAYSSSVSEQVTAMKKLEQQITELEAIAISGTNAYRELLRKKAQRSRKLGEIRTALQRELVRELRTQKETIAAKMKRSQQIQQRLRDQMKVHTTNIQQLHAPRAKHIIDDLEQQKRSQEQVVQHLDVQVADLKKPGFKMIEVQQDALVPPEKDRSRQFKYAGVAGLGMFGLLLFAVAFVEFQTRKINSPEEVTKGLGLGIVGTVPNLPLRVRKSTANPSPKDAVWQNLLTEAIDSIRTLMLHAARTEGLQVFLLTSAVKGEGKTSLSTQLAASLARAWKKTLLIDGDLRNPAGHKIFNVPNEQGFSEVLRGEVHPDDVTCPTPISRLWIMPAGQWDSHAVQALAQEGVTSLFDDLKDNYDFIIVDSCPVLPVADTLLLAQHVDAVVFSILRDVSRAPSVYAAQQRLAQLGVRILGGVVIGAGTTDFKRGQYPIATT
ncbi:MAG: polysaccharide biosynthesis tyrosine autokinase [Gemmataceae bacterium]